MKGRELRRATRIVILCEGETEVIAVQEFIRSQWEKDGLTSIGLEPIDLRGKLEDVHVRVPLHLSDHRIIAVFTLIDLYEIKRIQLPKHADLMDRVEEARRWLRDEIDKDHRLRFHPHLSVHEVEAWILAEGQALATRLRNSRIAAETNAEEKNDLNPPKKRLHVLFKQNGYTSGYRETLDGKPLFRQLDFQTVYQSCRYFRTFYDDLAAVAKQALGG